MMKNAMSLSNVVKVKGLRNHEESTEVKEV